MSALGTASFVNSSRPFWKANNTPMTVSSIIGLSSVNGTVYPPIAVLPEYFPSVEINEITSLSTINGSIYPPLVPVSNTFSTIRVSSMTGVSTINGSSYPPAAAGPRVLYGKMALGTNGQTVIYSSPFTSSVSVVVQGTSNAAGVNGFFTVATYGSLSQFQVFYSGQLVYGPIEVFWIAVGT